MSGNKNKTLIVTPCGLPIPAVKGGAVLTLTESIIKQNEVNDILDLSIVGIYDNQAIEEAKTYKNTDFIFLKPSLFYKFSDKIMSIFEKLAHKKHRQIWRKLYVLRKLKKILISDEYDSVVFENAGYLLRVLKNKKISDKYESKLFYHLHNDIPDNIYKEGVKKCRLLLISNYLSKKIIKLCGEDIKKQCLILHNGFDYARFAQQLSNSEKERLLSSLGIPADKKIIIFAGRIDPTKGIYQLVECVSQLDRPDVMLLIIGSHNFGSFETSAFAKKMSLKFAEMTDKIRFTGYVPYADIWKYYKLADVAVLPSMWEEPMGLTIVEAMSAGLPVVTTVSGGIPEFIDERFGILLERNESLIENMKRAIYEILDNYDKWRAKGQAASVNIASVIDEYNFYYKFCSYVCSEFNVNNMHN